MDWLGERYRIVSPLGSGGMGEVVLAEDVHLGRRVAIKLLHAEREHDEVARERLRREARAAAALDHPYICKIHEIGEADGRTFIVMEYVEGETLEARTRRELLPIRRVVEIAHELAQALEVAHGRAVIHRDLKPSNVMLTTQGHVKVLDFGLAKHVAAPALLVNDSTSSTRLTDAGTRLGTPAYMSPEQIVGGTLDARSDLFSLGVLLQELATGAHPFQRVDAAETMTAILRDLPAAGPRDVESVPGLRALLQRLMAKAPADRLRAVGELRAELDAIRDRVYRMEPATESAMLEPYAAAERTPFVGRAAETTELTRLLDRLLLGQGGLVLIGGEPGVGKTRLARELLRVARQRGCLSLTGHCAEAEGAPPFAPFIETIEQAVRLVPQAVRAAMGEQAAELSTIVPSLRRTYHDIPPTPEVPPEQQRRLIFSAYLDYLQRATAQAPSVVLLDDLHWADDASLQLLLHLAPQLAAMRLVVVGTYRDVELDVARPFATTLETLLRQRLGTRLSLRRLNESGVEQLLAAASGLTPPAGLASVVFRETEGNPFFVEEVYQHLVEEGKLFDAGGQWQANLRLDELEVPEGVRLVIGRRLARLGEGARKVLTAAAVIGRRFAVDLLPAVVDLPEETVFDAIEAAERAQLVAVEPGDREVRYAFVHELIRTTLVSGLLLPRRQRLHLKIANVIERQRAATLESQASVLAHHLFQAGAAADPMRTARYLVLAGRRALAAGAFEEAGEAGDRVMSLELADDAVIAAEAHEIRGAAYLSMARLDEAVESFEHALTRYMAQHDDAGIARAATGVSSAWGYRARFPEANNAMARGLAALSDSSVEERAALHGYLGGGLAAMSELDEAATEFVRAVETAEGLPNVDVLSRVLGMKAFYHFWSGECEDALVIGRRALALSRPASVLDRANVLAQVAYLAFLMGRPEEARRLLPELDVVARRAGAPQSLWIHQVVQHATDWMRTGDTRTLLAQADRWRRSASQWPFLSEAWTAVCELYLGGILEALDRLGSIVAAQPEHRFDRGMPEGNLFAATALVGQLDRAHALFASVRSKLPIRDRRNLVGAWYALGSAVVGLAILDDDLECGRLYPLTCDLIGTGTIVSATVGPTTPQLAAGIAAHAAGLADRAREHFDIAQRLADELPYRLLQPTVRYWYGRFLAAQLVAEEQIRGRAMIEAAATDFHSLEMVPHAALAEQWLRTGRG